MTDSAEVMRICNRQGSPGTQSLLGIPVFQFRVLSLVAGLLVLLTVCNGESTLESLEWT